MYPRGAALALLWLAACEPEAPPRDAGPGPTASATSSASIATPKPPFEPAELAGKARVIDKRSDVRLSGPELQVEHGDWLIESDDAIALIAAESGRVLAFGPPGGPTGIEEYGPAAFDAFSELDGKIERCEAAVDGRAVHWVKRLFGMPLTIDAWIGLSDRTLLLRWTLSASEAVPAITPGEQLWWGNTPSWVEGRGFVESSGAYSGSFIARESLGLAYAFCRDGGRVTGRFGSPDLPGFHRSARTGEQRIAIDAGASSAVRKVAMSFARGSIGDAMAALPCRPPVEEIAIPEATRVLAAGIGATIQIAHCESKRTYDARRELAANSPKKTKADELGAERAPGPLFSRFRVKREPSAILVPRGECSRVRLIAAGHAPGSWFDPTDEKRWSAPPTAPRAGAIAWEIRDHSGATIPAALVIRGEEKTPAPNWGEDGDGGAAREFAYLDRDGQRPVPPGRYRVTIHRGPEYSLDERTITVKTGETVKLAAKLERVVDTAGWLSADLHVHALPSFDAPVLLEDRVRSLAAVGVEVAVATDHNAVTDYQPAIAALALGPWLASVVGDEVTTVEPRLGHFNVFPLAAGSRPLVYRHARPSEIFAAARRAAPAGVVQVNHPRMGDIGYFELFHFDRAAKKSWQAESPLADLGFDAIEIFNGDHYADLSALQPILEDWYALLGAGLPAAASGNSDSHKIAYQEAGMPRNWVLVDHDEPARFDPAAFIAAIRKGHVIVSSGPFVDFRVGEARPGDSVAAGAIEAHLRVDAPPWMDLSQVEIIKSGEVVRRFTVERNAAPRFDKTIALSASSGDWLVAIARGARPMKQLYRSGALPFAFTNPIRVK